MPRWICAEMDYADRAHLAFYVGIIKRNKCGGRRKPISFSATRDGGGGLASAKVPSANQRSGVTFRRNALPSFITGHGWPRLPMPGRSSRGCIGKLNLNNRLSLSKSLHYFPRAPERLQAAKALSMLARALPNPGVTAAAGREAVPSVRRCEQCLSLKER